MADNVSINPGTTTPIATDDVGGVQYQRMKLTLGADGAAADIAPVDVDTGAGTDNAVPVAVRLPASGGGVTAPGDATNGLDVDVTRVQGNVAVTSAAASQADGHSASLGATTDAEVTGNGSVIGILKRLRTLLAGGLPAALTAGGGVKTGLVDALPAGTNTIGKVDQGAAGTAGWPVKTAAGDEVATKRVAPSSGGLLDDAGNAYTVKYAAVAATADGDNTVVAAVTNKKIVVIGYVLTATAAGLVTVKSATTTIGQIRSGADGGGASYAGGPDAPAFETAAGAALVVNNPTGVDTYGHVTYLEV